MNNLMLGSTHTLLFCVAMSILCGCSCGFAAHIGSHLPDGSAADAITVDAATCLAQDVRFVSREPTQDERIACLTDVDHPTNWFWTGTQCVPYSFQSCSNNLFCEGADCGRGLASADACLRAHSSCFARCGLALSASLICVEQCDGTYSATTPQQANCGAGATSTYDESTRTQRCTCAQCVAQTARGNDPNCTNSNTRGSAWNGFDCIRLCDSNCAGSNCVADMFPTRRQCLESHAGCARAMCSEMDVQALLLACDSADGWAIRDGRCTRIKQCACDGFDCDHLFASEADCSARISACSVPQCPIQTGQIEFSRTGDGTANVTWIMQPGWYWTTPNVGPAGYHFFINDIEHSGTGNARFVPQGEVSIATLSAPVRFRAVSPCGTWEQTYVPPLEVRYPHTIENIRIEWR